MELISSIREIRKYVDEQRAREQATAPTAKVE
jgi:hypothetical protein